MIQTKRLILRPWKEEDLLPFAKMCTDPRVMEFFPALLTKEEAEQAAERYQSHIQKMGWGFWAVEEIHGAPFIGFIGLMPCKFFHHPFAPTVEIGWRLAHEFWGQGYATEGAKAALDYGFMTLNLEEIISFTAQVNLRSQNVMKKLGMHRDQGDDFEHPKVPEGHILRHHVLYRLQRSEYLSLKESF